MKTDSPLHRVIRKSIACAVFCLLAGAWLVVGAQAASQESAPADPAAAVEPLESKSPLQLLHLEIEAIVQAGRDRVALLESELESVEDLEAALVLHRAIETAKAQTEIELFQAQIVHAEKMGRVDLAETIRSLMTNLAERNGIDLEEASSEPASPEPAER